VGYVPGIWRVMLKVIRAIPAPRVQEAESVRSGFAIYQKMDLQNQK
jgi:hypothetical protein